jgi:hypothetical protein
MINAHRPQLWRPDLTAAALTHRRWLLEQGQLAYRQAREDAVLEVESFLSRSEELRVLAPGLLLEAPALLTTMRMSTAPTLARERLAVLAQTERSVITALERGRLPARISGSELDRSLERICDVVTAFLDPDLFPWVLPGRAPSDVERARASLVVADRRCDAVADQILRQAQRTHQQQLLSSWLCERGYRPVSAVDPDLTSLSPGSFYLGQVTVSGPLAAGGMRADAVIQPLRARTAKTVVIKGSVNPESARADRYPFGPTRIGREDPDLRLLLLLGGSADDAYLRAKAAEGMDWIWEHRVEDLTLAGV